MPTLISFPNLGVFDGGAESEPWQFTPAAGLEQQLRQMEKGARRRKLLDKEFVWNIYSGVRALDPQKRASETNPIVGLRAFIADYDVTMSDDAVEDLLKQIPADFQPTYAEKSLSGKWHFIWLFSREVSVLSNAMAKLMFEKIAKFIQADRWMAGYDPQSSNPTQVYTNGVKWFEVSQPFNAEPILGIAIKEVQNFRQGTELPMTKIADEVQKRFPGRWTGEFVEGAVGVRFWDSKADNPRGAYITKTGCYCVTGLQPFVSWSEIFGHQWVEQQKYTELGKAAEDVYFDGKFYWKKQGELYLQKSREDTLLQLAIEGLSKKAQKGQNVSEAERVLNHIQNANRVDGAAPIIYQPQGPMIINGTRILNTSTVKAMEPYGGPVKVTTSDYPFLHKFCPNLLTHIELGSWRRLHGWTKRTYLAAYEQKPVPGQAVLLCGPRSNGKTLFCLRILAAILGGRISNPYQYMLRNTSFSSDIFKSGLLAINDEDAPSDERERKAWQQAIKAFVANPSQTYHPKFCEKMSIEWLGRLFITLNEDPQSIEILPEINSNTRDKIMLFGSQPFDGLWPDKYTLERQIIIELPYWIRGELIDRPYYEDVIEPGSRMGVISFHDPEIIKLSRRQEHSYNLYELLEVWQKEGLYWTDPSAVKTEWEGTATELLTLLCDTQRAGILLKDWSTYKVAKALTTLARNGSKGIEVIGTARGRKFKIRKFQ